ncbi:MAG: lipopolysaccharide biosynthesis protein [Hyphomicrobiaceae bacterium]|nr:lipopolysaccharide biosynthesis protein [Hyphomicrobiaceae bacterium]
MRARFMRHRPMRSGLVRAGLLVGLRCASAGLTFGLQIFLARIMAPEEYGFYVIAWTALLVLGSLAGLGFAEAAVRFIPRYEARGRTSRLAHFLAIGAAATLAGGLGLALAFGLVGMLAPLAPEWRVVVLIVAAGLPFLAVEFYAEGVARGLGWYGLTTVPSYFLRPIAVAGGAFLIAAETGAIGAAQAGVVLVAVLALLAAGSAALVHHRVRRVLTEGRRGGLAHHERPGARLWVCAALPLMLVGVIEDVLHYGDVLILGMLLEPEEVAVYFAASRSMALASFVAYAFYLVAGRDFALAQAGRDRRLLETRVRAASRATFWCTLAAVVLTLAAGPVVLAAFGEAYRVGYAVMAILAVGFVVQATAGQASELLLVLGHARAVVAVGAAAIAVNVLMIVLMAPQWGIVGGAIAAAVTMALRATALILVCRAKTGIAVFAVGWPWPGRSRGATAAAAPATSP